MLGEALAGECVFSVSRLQEGDDGEEDRISEIGTAGLVRASREGPDGTSQLLLHGVIRVRFREWIDGKGFPCAVIEPVACVPLPEGQAAAAMKTLKGAVEDAIGAFPEEVRSAVMAMLDQADDPGLMSDLVAQQFVHDVDLRQELLETLEVGVRVRLLCEFLDRLEVPG